MVCVSSSGGLRPGEGAIVSAGLRTFEFGPAFRDGYRSEWCLPPEGDPEKCYGLEDPMNAAGPILRNVDVDVWMVGSSIVEWGRRPTPHPRARLVRRLRSPPYGRFRSTGYAGLSGWGATSASSTPLAIASGRGTGVLRFVLPYF